MISVRSSAMISAKSAVNSALKSAESLAMNSAEGSTMNSTKGSAMNSALKSAGCSAVNSAKASVMNSALKSAKGSAMNSALDSATGSAMNSATERVKADTGENKQVVGLKAGDCQVRANPMILRYVVLGVAPEPRQVRATPKRTVAETRVIPSHGGTQGRQSRSRFGPTPLLRRFVLQKA
jgi:hypothetical protein